MFFKIISVDFKIDVDDVTNTKMNSEISLLDGDIILINPAKTEWCFGEFKKYGGSGNEYVTMSQNSIQKMKKFKERKEEIERLLYNGKIIISFLAPIQTMKMQKNRNSYPVYSNYNWLPDELNYLPGSIRNGTGESIFLDDSNYFTSFYSGFKNQLNYKAYLISGSIDNLNLSDKLKIKNNTGNLVGFSKKVGNGLMIFLPYISDEFNSKKLVDILIQCSKPFLTNNLKTEPPNWTCEFKIPGEKDLQDDIKKIKDEISDLKNNLDELNKDKNELTSFKKLLYEQGKPLEEEVKKSFELMGFEVTDHENDDMEHDIILECNKGRIIGEIEGKDNDPIRISKLDQLSRVVDEDFHRNDSYPEGILIGNGYRLSNIEDRPNIFTEKVQISADRKNFGLLDTVELYKISVKLLENPNNLDLKKEAREIIFDSLGNEIKF